MVHVFYTSKFVKTAILRVTTALKEILMKVNLIFRYASLSLSLSLSLSHTYTHTHTHTHTHTERQLSKAR